MIYDRICRSGEAKPRVLFNRTASRAPFEQAMRKYKLCACAVWVSKLARNIQFEIRHVENKTRVHLDTLRAEPQEKPGSYGRCAEIRPRRWMTDVRLFLNLLLTARSSTEACARRDLLFTSARGEDGTSFQQLDPKQRHRVSMESSRS